MIRVLLAEDHGVVRGTRAALLSLTGTIEVVAETGRGDRVVGRALEFRPDVAVVDIELPGLDGIAATALLREALPECRVLILTGAAQTGHLRRALDAGATGFLLKDAPAERLAESIRRVAAGERFIDPALAAAETGRRAGPLTERERAVLAALGRGASTGEVAAELCLSAATVRDYISGVIVKTRARDRADAVRIASELGWI
ncbi:response regulator transcription factor [Streptosporangium lutulentum]|uniref:Two-component system response regulator DesR n=1 Tax=Streptosporangium lutulentum TaxID=1461250 RepID=A0ABT9QG30_9ACTN|nr:response regulator transcription factor [Streptosporangium lutulentum]MDP9844999.1 two-component system response regulator DesR [Streptosporangium lutulentum]